MLEMVKYYSGLRTLALLPLHLSSTISSNDHESASVCTAVSNCFSIKRARIKLCSKQVSNNRCRASRRRVRYNEDDEEEEDEEYGYNTEIAMLEYYSQSARDEALIVRALVDEDEAEVLIFKGFSSSLSYRTSPDPSRSILPARAVIKSIDRVRGPFNPSSIEYLEKGLTWEAFKNRLQPK